MSGPSLLRRAEALVGLPYVDGQFDCGHLAVRAAAELFGRTVVLPGANPHPLDARAQGAVIAQARREAARPLQAPKAGCLVLFHQNAVDGAPGGRQWHLGTVIEVLPVVWVLHTVAGGSSVLQRLADCLIPGTRFEGWYEWI